MKTEIWGQKYKASALHLIFLTPYFCLNPLLPNRWDGHRRGATRSGLQLVMALCYGLVTNQDREDA